MHNTRTLLLLIVCVFIQDVVSYCPIDVTGIITTTDYCLNLRGLCRPVTQECLFPLGNCQDPSTSADPTADESCVCCRNDNGQPSPPNNPLPPPPTIIFPINIDDDTGKCTFTDGTAQQLERNYCKNTLGGECFISISNRCIKILGPCTLDEAYHDGCVCCRVINDGGDTPLPTPITPTTGSISPPNTPPSSSPPTDSPPPSSPPVKYNHIYTRFNATIRDIRYYDTCLITMGTTIKEEEEKIIRTDNSLGKFILNIDRMGENDLIATIDTEFGDKIKDVNNQYFDCSTISFDQDHVWLYYLSAFIIPSSEKYMRGSDLHLNKNTQRLEMNEVELNGGYKSEEEYPQLPVTLDFFSLIPKIYNITTIEKACEIETYKGIIIGLLEYEKKTSPNDEVNRTKVNIVAGNDEDMINQCSNQLFSSIIPGNKNIGVNNPLCYASSSSISINDKEKMHIREFEFTLTGCKSGNHPSSGDGSNTSPTIATDNLSSATLHGLIVLGTIIVIFIVGSIIILSVMYCRTGAGKKIRRKLSWIPKGAWNIGESAGITVPLKEYPDGTRTSQYSDDSDDGEPQYRSNVIDNENTRREVNSFVNEVGFNNDDNNDAAILSFSTIDLSERTHDD